MYIKTIVFIHTLGNILSNHMKKIILLIIIVFYNLTLISQTSTKIKKNNDSITDTFNNITTIIKEQNHVLEKNELKQKHYQETTENKLSHLETKLNNEIEKVDTKYGYYLIFGGILISIFVFITTYYGRDYIKKRVENLIKKTASDYSETAIDIVLKKYTDDGKIDKLIQEKGEPAIKKILNKIENDGTLVLDELKVRGDKAISSMLAMQDEKKDELTSESTDEEIKIAGRQSRVREFFDLAFSNKDPLIQIELYKNVLEIEPNHIPALNNIGAAYNNAYNYQEAITHLEKCIEQSPGYTLAYANLANSYNLLNKLDKALELASKAIEIDPKIDWSYSVKGNILTKQGKLEEAEQTFGKAVELNPKSPEAYFTRGFFFEETGHYKKSEKDYDMAKSLGFPNTAMLYNNYAVLYRRQKKFKKAIKFLEKARKENPSFPNIDGTLALIYADQKDRDNFYKYLIIALDKGCQVWRYLHDKGFDEYREEEKLIALVESYRKKYIA